MKNKLLFSTFILIFSFVTGFSQNQQKAEQTMQKWFDSFDTNDREGLSKTVSSDFKVHHPAYKEPLDFDRFYNEIVAGMHQSFTNIKHTVKDRVLVVRKQLPE
ncbi:MAG: hypothetical protein H0U27_07135, partial [Nitrosopumilus sp.]|nr:hypothetical protein [Nitrosopumilus sp.]